MWAFKEFMCPSVRSCREISQALETSAMGMCARRGFIRRISSCGLPRACWIQGYPCGWKLKGWLYIFFFFLVCFCSSTNFNVAFDPNSESSHSELGALFKHHNLSFSTSREAVVPHPWRCSRLGWMRPWAAWAGDGQPWPWQGSGWVGFGVPSNASHSVILAI